MRRRRRGATCTLRLATRVGILLIIEAACAAAIRLQHAPSGTAQRRDETGVSRRSCFAGRPTRPWHRCRWEKKAGWRERGQKRHGAWYGHGTGMAWHGRGRCEIARAWINHKRPSATKKLRAGAERVKRDEPASSHQPAGSSSVRGAVGRCLPTVAHTSRLAPRPASSSCERHLTALSPHRVRRRSRCRRPVSAPPAA